MTQLRTKCLYYHLEGGDRRIVGGASYFLYQNEDTTHMTLLEGSFQGSFMKP